MIRRMELRYAPKTHTALRFKIGLKMIAKIRNSLARALLLLVVQSMLGDVIGSGLVLDRREDGLNYLAVVGPEFMNASRLEKLHDERARKNPSPSDLIIISAFENRADAAQTLSGKVHTEITYDDWRTQYEAAMRRAPLRMMQLISIGTDVVLRSATGTGVSRAVLGGSDPTMFEAGGRHYEILEIFFNRLPRSIRPDGRNPVIVSAYIKSDFFPTVEQGKEVSRILQKRLHHPTVVVNIRADTWFIEDPGFPLWFPFANDRTPPSFSEYKARGQMLCNDQDAEVICRIVPSAGR